MKSKYRILIIMGTVLLLTATIIGTMQKKGDEELVNQNNTTEYAINNASEDLLIQSEPSADILSSEVQTSNTLSSKSSEETLEIFSITQEGIAYETDNKFITLSQDAKLKVLMENYYNALLTANQELYNSITYGYENLNIDVTLRKTEYIRAYDNIHVYTAKGQGGIDLIAFVTYDLLINSIDTPAPSIDQLLIKFDKGEPKLYFGDLTATTHDYINNILNEEEVYQLIENVNTKFKDALATDSKLNDFYTSVLTELSEN